ncbi:MAG: M28 family peptidase [Clostridia bacterium]|nr:M28 family peptidase [Clostridia bacterium]
MKKTFNSKKIYLIAIVLLIVSITVFFVGCKSKQIQVNEIDGINASLGEKAYGYLQTLEGEELQNRTLGTQGELDAAKYISGLMTDWGYASEYSSEDGLGLQEFKTSFKRFDGEEINGALAHNVIFSKKSGEENSKGEIILACGYDNLYSEKADISGNLWNADGSYESGSSVAVMLTLAETLKDKSCDYDLTFAFFSGSCYGWKGAMDYVENLDRAQLDKIALVVNFAMLGGGDNWYIYSGESKNSYGSYLNACGGDNVTAVPKDRNIGQFVLTSDAIYNYANIGMLSNQYFFDVKKIPTANFLSLNWEINDNPLFSEMKGKDNVYHTKNDTLQNMIERKGEDGVKAQLFEVVKTTLTALDSSNKETLEAVLDTAKSQLPGGGAQNGQSATFANFIIKIVVIAILIAISFAIRANLSKNMDKYIKAKKAKEGNNGDAQEEKKPFEDAQIDATDAQETPKTQKNTENKRDDDPFV